MVIYHNLETVMHKANSRFLLFSLFLLISFFLSSVSSPSVLFPACVRAVGGCTASVHPSQLPAERGGQRGADQIFRGLQGPGERSQALPHAATRPPRDADAQNSPATVCRYIV